MAPLRWLLLHHMRLRCLVTAFVGMDLVATVLTERALV
jgi:hypothetical protein